jgi:hypothetical protein
MSDKTKSVAQIVAAAGSNTHHRCLVTIPRAWSKISFRLASASGKVMHLVEDVLKVAALSSIVGAVAQETRTPSVRRDGGRSLHSGTNDRLPEGLFHFDQATAL